MVDLYGSKTLQLTTHNVEKLWQSSSSSIIATLFQEALKKKKSNHRHIVVASRSFFFFFFGFDCNDKSELEVKPTEFVLY